MNEKELELARKGYTELMQQREKELKEKEIKLESLEENPIVSEYKRISYDVSDEGKRASKNSVLEKSFGVIAQNTKRNDNIYVFIGYYGIANTDSFAVPLSVNNPHVRYNYYVNLETLGIKKVDKEKNEIFEKQNIIIYLDEPSVYHHIGFYRKKFNELRNMYFEHLIDKSQEEAIKQIIKKR